MIQVYLKTIEGVEPVTLAVEPSLTIPELDSELRQKLPEVVSKRSIISETNGRPITKYNKVSDLLDRHSQGESTRQTGYINLHLRIPMCGGKGGFGNSLKAQGGKMRKGKTDKSNYKTLDGIRVKTLKQLQKVDQHMKSLSEAERQRLQKKRDKLQAILNMNTVKTAQGEAKYDDEKYLLELEKTMDDIKDAVGSVMDVSDDEEEKEEEEEDNEKSELEQSDSDASDEEPTEPLQKKLDAFFD